MIKLKELFNRHLDWLFSRWGNVSINCALFVLFTVLALITELGFFHDAQWFFAGIQLGFAVCWLVNLRPTTRSTTRRDTDCGYP
jgi:hypothetical protein